MESDNPLTQKIASAYKSFGGQLIRFFQKRTNNHHDAHDLSQDVLTLWLNRKSQAPVEDQRAFLFKIANNVLIDHWRKKQKQQSLSQTEYEFIEENENLVNNQEPSSILEHQQRLELFSEALESLPPRRKEAFVLYCFDGLRQSEIADQMGISISMVEKHIAAALLHCKGYVAAQQEVRTHDE